MGSGLMKVQDIVLEKAVELLFMPDQEVIQAFSSYTAQKAFTDGICSWRPVRRSKHFETCAGYIRYPWRKLRVFLYNYLVY